MTKYLVLRNYTSQDEDYDPVSPDLRYLGITDDFNKVKEIVEEDLNDLAYEYADCHDPEDDDETEKYVDEYVHDAVYYDVKAENLKLNETTDFLTNYVEWGNGCGYDKAEYYVIKVED